MSTTDALEPSPALLSRLGSIIVHAEELLSPGGHPVDREAMAALLADPEVAKWLEAMDAMALLPVKRCAR